MYIQDMKAKYIPPIFVSCSGGYLAAATRVAGEPTLHLMDLQKDRFPAGACLNLARDFHRTYLTD